MSQYRRPPHPKEIESVMALSGSARAEYTMKKIADWEELWGLYMDGWAMAALDQDDTEVFPIWPAREFAEVCAQGEWSSFQPRAIGLSEFMDEFLPDLSQKSILIGVFSHPLATTCR